MHGRAAAALLLVCAAPCVVTAQMMNPHAHAHSHAPGAAWGRALHDRVALADAASVATVDAVEPGRIHLRDATPVFGGAPERFAVKRAPSRPPPLEPGDRALLLLRGARAPYLLVDEPAETRTLRDDADAARWVRATRAVHGAGGSAAALASLYRDWLDGDDEALAREALVGMADPEAPFRPLAPADAQRLVALALDPDRDAGLRDVALAVALSDEGSRGTLLARLPGDDANAVPAELLRRALRTSVGSHPAETRAVLLRALRHPSPRVRLAALDLGPGLAAAHDGELRGVLARMAESDPDADVRHGAARQLARSRRRTDPDGEPRERKRAEVAGPSRASDGAGP